MQSIRMIKKYRMILSKHQMIRIVQLGMMMILGGIMETCSVSLILPFMNAVLNPDTIMHTWYGKLIWLVFHPNSSGALLVVSSILLALLYVLKNLYLMFEHNIQYRFVYGNMFELQKRLLETFIHRPYEYFLTISSGEVLRIVSSDTADAFNLLIILLMLCTELVVSIMLISAIFVITPKVTLCIASLLLIIMIFIYIVVKPILRRAGENKQKSGASMNKWLLQSIQGIKELKVMQKEYFFQESYNKNGEIYVRSLHWNQMLGAAPRFMIEGICMGIMYIMIAAMIYQGRNLESIIPILTVVAMAAIRLLPSVNRISGALAQVAYGEPMLDKVIENLQMLESGEDSGRNGAKVDRADGCPDHEDAGVAAVPKLRQNIEFRSITYRYPQSAANILSCASMMIHRGESVGIVGSSGAGKTTSVDIMLGLLNPQEGQILVDGTDIRLDPASWLSQLSYIPQMIFMLDETIRANVAFGEKNVDDRAVWKALKEAALDGFVKDLPQGLDTEIGERGVRLSGGQRQRIGIARALYRNPEVLIFDEATSALDNETEMAIMESIRSFHGSKTIIIIAHRLTTIEACDHVYRVENGSIFKER